MHKLEIKGILYVNFNKEARDYRKERYRIRIIYYQAIIATDTVVNRLIVKGRVYRSRK